MAPEGELDIATAAELAQALVRAQAAATDAVVLDLHGVAFMDVAGMRVILAAEARARSDGRELEIIRYPRQVRRVFALCQSITASLSVA